MSLRVLTRDLTKHGVHHPLLALDVENDPKTGAFICAGLFGKIGAFRSVRRDDKVIKVKYETDVREYFSALADLHEYLLALKRGSCLLIFYNLSYDVVYLRDILDKPKRDRTGNVRSPILMVGTRVITARLRNGIKCLDLFNHTCEGSLEWWCKCCGFGIEKKPLTDLPARVMTDAEITFRLGSFIEDFYYQECGVPLQLTVGANALKLFTMKYFTDYWLRDDDQLSMFERAAYYGGRTEIFKRGSLHTFSYDINSTYLSIMRSYELPDVISYRWRANDRTWESDLGLYFDKHLAIIKCRVRAPGDLYIGILPVRVNKKLTFPRGEFDGTWCNIELAEAVKHGYQILKIYSYVFYTHSRKYFSKLADFIWQKRVKYRAAGNAGMDQMIKRLGNSLYGKFAERHGNEIVCKLSDIDFIIDGKFEIFKYLNDDYIRLYGDLIPSAHEFPCIPAFITAYARVILYRAMFANQKLLIYCDTDSIKTNSPARGIDISDDLGEWKFEGESETEFYRSKFYGDKHKGVPAKAEVIEKTERYIKFKYEKPIREREAMRRNLTPNVWVDIIKTLLFDDDKRDWYSKSKSLPFEITKEEYAPDFNGYILLPDKYRNRLAYGGSDRRDNREYERAQADEFQARLDNASTLEAKYFRQKALYLQEKD